MLVCDYIVKQIDGDYAHLQRVDQTEEELKVVARALLPAEIYEGCELHYCLLYTSRITPSFIFAIVSELIRCSVSGVIGQ